MGLSFDAEKANSKNEIKDGSWLSSKVSNFVNLEMMVLALVHHRSVHGM